MLVLVLGQVASATSMVMAIGLRVVPHHALTSESAVPRCVLTTVSGPQRRVCHGECERLGLSDVVWASAGVHMCCAGEAMPKGNHAASAMVGIMQV